MQIKLDNIGIVKDSTIKLDSLTVITGKTLYSMLDAVCDLQRNHSGVRYPKDQCH